MRATLYMAIDCDHPDQEKYLKQLYKEQLQEKYIDFENNTMYLDSGFDIFVPDTIVYKGTPNNSKPLTIDHRIVAACYAHHEKKNGTDEVPLPLPLPYYLYPRSSISKTQLRMSNSVGIIDSGYRGHLMAKVDVKDTNPENEYKIEAGNRLFQICSHNLLPFKDIIFVDKNHPKVNKNRTERGEGGFGSSGV
jgi:dUTP pyrophosphatase